MPAPTCPRCNLPMKPGTNYEYQCVDGCEEWYFETPKDEDLDEGHQSTE